MLDKHSIVFISFISNMKLMHSLVLLNWRHNYLREKFLCKQMCFSERMRYEKLRVSELVADADKPQQGVPGAGRYHMSRNVIELSCLTSCNKSEIGNSYFNAMIRSLKQTPQCNQIIRVFFF